MIKERVLNTGGGGGVDMIHPQFKLSNDICIVLKSRWVITTNTCHSSFRLPSLLCLVIREITYGVCGPRRVTSPGGPGCTAPGMIRTYTTLPPVSS